MKFLKTFFSQNAHWVVNKELVRLVGGLEEAVLFTDFVDKYTFYETRDELIEIEGSLYFFATASQIEDTTLLSYHRQTQCINKLKLLGVIDTKTFGMPAKKYFTVCENALHSLFGNSFQKIQIHGLENLERSNIINDNNNIKELLDSKNSNPCIQNSSKLDITNINISIPTHLLSDEEKRQRTELFFDAFVNKEGQWLRLASEKAGFKRTDKMISEVKNYCNDVLYLQDRVCEHTLSTAKSHFINWFNKRNPKAVKQ